MQKNQNLVFQRRNEAVGTKRKENSKTYFFKEETSWRQKSRLQWLNLGDNNTRFYHNFANRRKARNPISSLSIDGSLTEDPNHIEKALVNFYTSLHTKNSIREAWFKSWKGKTISNQNASWLEREITSEEIKKASFDHPKGKHHARMVILLHSFKSFGTLSKRIYYPSFPNFI